MTKIPVLSISLVCDNAASKHIVDYWTIPLVAPAVFLVCIYSIIQNRAIIFRAGMKVYDYVITIDDEVKINIIPKVTSFMSY